MFRPEYIEQFKMKKKKKTSNWILITAEINFKLFFFEKLLKYIRIYMTPEVVQWNMMVNWGASRDEWEANSRGRMRVVFLGWNEKKIGMKKREMSVDASWISRWQEKKKLNASSLCMWWVCGKKWREEEGVGIYTGYRGWVVKEWNWKRNGRCFVGRQRNAEDHFRDSSGMPSPTSFFLLFLFTFFPLPPSFLSRVKSTLKNLNKSRLRLNYSSPRHASTLRCLPFFFFFFLSFCPLLLFFFHESLNLLFVYITCIYIYIHFSIHGTFILFENGWVGGC